MAKRGKQQAPTKVSLEDRLSFEVTLERSRRLTAQIGLLQNQLAQMSAEHQEATAEIERVKARVYGAYGIDHANGETFDYKTGEIRRSPPPVIPSKE